MKNYTDLQKLETVLRLHEELHQNYDLITKLSIIVIRRGLKMVFENPYSEQHYLTRYWCLKPSVIDKNRRLNGDYYMKPTQYWFIGFKPKNNFLFEPIEYVKPKNISDLWGTNQKDIEERSMIHPQYASRFIRQYLVDYETDIEKMLKGEG
jgi:hypothetical protein